MGRCRGSAERYEHAAYEPTSQRSLATAALSYLIEAPS